MKKSIISISAFFLILLLLNQIICACTVFHAANENSAFGGNNEDYNISDTYIYFYPPSEDIYGKVIVGYSGAYRIQGGMNEMGLFWDGLAAPYLEVKNSTDKPYFNGHIIDYILDTCVTCDEALSIMNQYNLKILENAQILMGDRYGNSFIIEGDGIHKKMDYYQVATNFYLSQFPGPAFPCWRYNTALDMFKNHPVDDLSVNFCASVLDAVHQEGTYPTQYSTVYDLKNGIVYLYYFHNYNKVKVFNLKEEFEQGYHSYSIPDIFEQESQPPNKPTKPIGKSNGQLGKKYYYKSSTIDIDNDIIYYLFDWGDGSNSDWQGPFKSGEECNISHVWNEKGEFEVKVIAKDSHELSSEWSDSQRVTLSKTKSFEYTFSLIFRFMNKNSLFKILTSPLYTRI